MDNQIHKDEKYTYFDSSDENLEPKVPDLEPKWAFRNLNFVI